MPATCQPAQRIRLALLTFALGLLTLPAYSLPSTDQAASPAEAKPAATAGGGIIAVQENGRKIYVNGAPTQSQPSRPAARHSVLVYWSNTEHRWKPVPAPTPAAMRAARTAASEVRGYVAAQPRVAGSSVSDPNYAALARGYRVSEAEIDRAIEQAASRNGVDPNLVRAIVKVESNFNPNAVSHKGAMGLMQLMPHTASQLSVSNPFDPQQNVDAGVRHLKHLLTNFNGDLRKSLAAYNAGEGAVTRNGGVPPYAETRDYVKRITDIYGQKGGRNFGTFYAPVHIYRGKDGVLSMTNTE